MNMMKMPGFTAEASFSETRGHYRSAGMNASTSGGLIPQLKRDDLPGASCGKDPVFGNVICVECTGGVCKTYVCDKDGNNCKETVRPRQFMSAGSLGGTFNVRTLAR